MDKEPKRYLGIDWGRSKIGLALGDDETCIAAPYKVIRDINEIIEIIKKEEIDIIVVGEPGLFISQKDNSNLSESLSPEYRKFIDDLELKSGVKVIKSDEKFTSKIAGTLAGDKNTKAPEDAIAAMLILQHYLDSLKN